jgi:hypothetical protein
MPSVHSQLATDLFWGRSPDVLLPVDGRTAFFENECDVFCHGLLNIFINASVTNADVPRRAGTHTFCVR